MSRYHLVGIAGSIRANSFNHMLLRAAGEVLPEDADLRIVRIDTLPYYNQDLDVVGVPPVVEDFRAAVRAADGLVIATPEYNYSMPGVLKNAIEWASRPIASSALAGKPIALMGASTGGFGTVRAQLALRQVFAGTNNPVVNRPEVLVGMAQNKFDVDGRLIDPQTLAFLRQSMLSFVESLRAAGELAAAS